MFDLVLYQPEIPQNTGNLIRLAANTGVRLCLIEPLGFSMDEKPLRRAGLDYHEWARVMRFDDLAHYLEAEKPVAVHPVSTRAAQPHTAVRYRAGCALLMGPETRGLPEAIIERWWCDAVRLPMRPGSRSLNLANAGSALVYEAWRQHGFAGGE